MNKRTIIGIAGLCAMALLSGSVLAQGGPGQGGPGGPPPMQGPGMRRMDSRMMLIQMKSVQQELKLTQEQISAIQKIHPPMGPGGPPPQGGQGRPPQGGPPQGGPPQGGPPQGGFGPGGGGPPQGGFDGPMHKSPLDDILNDGQSERLKQLQIQFDAPMSMLDPRQGEALKLSETQRMKLDEIVQSAFPRPTRPQGGPGQAGPGQGGPGQPQPGQGPGQPMTWQERQAKKAAAYRQALAILNENQRSVWKSLTGAEFTKWEEVRMAPPGGQRGGQRGGPPPAP